MELAWIRGENKIRFDRTASWFCLGVRGSGKSSYLETLGETYLENGCNVLDLFASRDGESLGWLRAPHIDKSDILLLHGSGVEVTSAPCETREVSELTLKDLDRYKVTISSSPLYTSPEAEFTEVNKLTDLLYKRLVYEKMVYTIVREAANLYYSRLRVSANQTLAKAQQTYLIRESRHLGLILGLDTLKYTSVDSDIRATIDYLVFKSLGVHGLPRDMWWIYKFIDPSTMRRMKPNEFVLMTRTGNLALGVFDEVKWHKQERENIMREVGVKVEYSTPVQYGEDKGSFKTLGDREHAELVAAYIENRHGGMNKLAEVYSISAGTVSNHTRRHNKAVELSGVCPMCERAGSEYASLEAKRMG